MFRFWSFFLRSHFNKYVHIFSLIKFITCIVIAKLVEHNTACKTIIYPLRNMMVFESLRVIFDCSCS